jgi:hypothetical protein
LCVRRLTSGTILFTGRALCLSAVPDFKTPSFYKLTKWP